MMSWRAYCLCCFSTKEIIVGNTCKQVELQNWRSKVFLARWTGLDSAQVLLDAIFVEHFFATSTMCSPEDNRLANVTSSDEILVISQQMCAKFRNQAWPKVNIFLQLVKVSQTDPFPNNCLRFCLCNWLYCHLRYQIHALNHRATRLLVCDNLSHHQTEQIKLSRIPVSLQFISRWFGSRDKSQISCFRTWQCIINFDDFLIESGDVLIDCLDCIV